MHLLKRRLYYSNKSNIKNKHTIAERKVRKAWCLSRLAGQPCWSFWKFWRWSCAGRSSSDARNLFCHGGKRYWPITSFHFIFLDFNHLSSRHRTTWCDTVWIGLSDLSKRSRKYFLVGSRRHDVHTLRRIQGLRASITYRGRARKLTAIENRSASPDSLMSPVLPFTSKFSPIHKILLSGMLTYRSGYLPLILYLGTNCANHWPSTTKLTNTGYTRSDPRPTIIR